MTELNIDEKSEKRERRQFLTFIGLMVAIFTISIYLFSTIHIPEGHSIFNIYQELMQTKHGVFGADVNALIPNQSVAMTILLAIVVGTLMFWRFRLAFALIGVFILLLTRSVSLSALIESMSLDIIVFAHISIARRNIFHILFLSFLGIFLHGQSH